MPQTAWILFGDKQRDFQQLGRRGQDRDIFEDMRHILRLHHRLQAGLDINECQLAGSGIASELSLGHGFILLRAAG